MSFSRDVQEGATAQCYSSVGSWARAAAIQGRCGRHLSRRASHPRGAHFWPAAPGRILPRGTRSDRLPGPGLAGQVVHPRGGPPLRYVRPPPPPGARLRQVVRCRTGRTSTSVALLAVRQPFWPPARWCLPPCDPIPGIASGYTPVRPRAGPLAAQVAGWVGSTDPPPGRWCASRARGARSVSRRVWRGLRRSQARTWILPLVFGSVVVLSSCPCGRRGRHRTRNGGNTHECSRGGRPNAG